MRYDFYLFWFPVRKTLLIPYLPDYFDARGPVENTVDFALLTEDL